MGFLMFVECLWNVMRYVIIKMLCPLCVMFKYVCVCVCTDCSGSKAEDRLFRRIFRRYNQYIRPVENVSDPVTVQFEVSMSQLVKVVSAPIHVANLLYVCT